jgi:hypothetical protein
MVAEARRREDQTKQGGRQQEGGYRIASKVAREVSVKGVEQQREFGLGSRKGAQSGIQAGDNASRKRSSARCIKKYRDALRSV